MPYFNLLVILPFDFHVYFGWLLSIRAHLKGSSEKKGKSTGNFWGRGPDAPSVRPCSGEPLMPLLNIATFLRTPTLKNIGEQLLLMTPWKFENWLKDKVSQKLYFIFLVFESKLSKFFKESYKTNNPHVKHGYRNVSVIKEETLCT